MNNEQTAQTITLDLKTFDALVSALKCCAADLEGVTSSHREEWEQRSLDEASKALAGLPIS
jgi:hypothetical protein